MGVCVCVFFWGCDTHTGKKNTLSTNKTNLTNLTIPSVYAGFLPVFWSGRGKLPV
jgi:hypothetical protein